MPTVIYNKAAGRASIRGPLTKGHLRQLARDGPRIVYFETVADTLIDSAIELSTVRQIVLDGQCSIGPVLLECFPKLEKLRAKGYIKIRPLKKRLYLKEVEVTDLTSSIADILDFIQTERLEVTGSAISLKEAILGQERLLALRLQETKLDLHDINPILQKLKVLCVYRTYQNDYSWLRKLKGLEMLSVAYQKGLRDISAIGDIATLSALDISSQRGLSGFESLGRLNQLKLLSFLNLGTIPSIQWVRFLANLRIINLLGDCTIADGKIGFLKDLRLIEAINIKSRRGYDAEAASLTRLSALEGLELCKKLGLRF